MHARAVGPLADDLDTPDWPVLFQRQRQRELIVGHRRAVQVEERPSPAPSGVAEPGTAPPDVGGSPVEEGDPPRGIGCIDGSRQRSEELAKDLLALAQALLRDPVLGDVTGHAEQSDRSPFGVAHDGAFDCDPMHLASLRVIGRIHHLVLGLAHTAWRCGRKRLVHAHQIVCIDEAPHLCNLFRVAPGARVVGRRAGRL